MIVLLMLMISGIGYAVIYGLEYAGVKMPWTAADNADTVADTNKLNSTSKPEKVVVASTVDKHNPKVPAPKKPKQDKPDTTKHISEPTVIKTATAISKPQSKKAASTVKSSKPAIAEPKQPVVWPVVKLKGILGIGRGGAIMLDNKIIGVGEKYEGITIIKIESRGAWLEFEKEKRFLKMGKSTE